MLNDTLIAIARHMKIEFEKSSLIDHSLLKGQHREQIVVEQYLKKYLPRKYGISSGIVIDSYGNQSKQQDIIIYDKFNTMHLSGENRDDDEQLYIPIENVFAVIEVKSNLTNEEVADVVEKFESVNRLVQKPVPINPIISFNSAFPAPSGFCFAYTASGQLVNRAIKLRERRLERGYEKHLSGIIILDQGVIQYSDNENIMSININPIAPNVSETLYKGIAEGENLLHFTMMLNQVLNSTVLEQPDLLEYLKNAKDDKSNTIIVPFELINDEMRINIQGKSFSIRSLANISMARGRMNEFHCSPYDVLTDDHQATQFLFACYLRLKLMDISSNTINKECIPQFGLELDYKMLRSIIEPHLDEIQKDTYILTEDELAPIRKQLIIALLQESLIKTEKEGTDTASLESIKQLMETDTISDSLSSILIRYLKQTPIELLRKNQKG